MQISQLLIYPIKSCAAVSLERAALSLRGLENDRLLQVTTPDGEFLTQREFPRLALIRPQLQGNRLTLRADSMSELSLRVGDTPRKQVVTTWGNEILACDQGDEVAEWLRGLLGVSVRLMRIADAFVRQCDQRYARRASDQTGFADGFPLLVTNSASLADLNTRLLAQDIAPVGMERFRPNIVLEGAPAWAEDGWQQLQTENMLLDVVKPCARCVITTTDQLTAQRGKEPLRTLAQFRAVNGKTLFGQNVCHLGLGELWVGQEVNAI